MDLNRAREIAAGAGWLSRQPLEFRKRMLSEAQVRECPAGDVISSLGDPPRGLFCIIAGFVDVLIAPGPFPPTLVYIARRGWWVGEAALITRTTRRAALNARTDATYLYLPEKAVGKLARERPDMWGRLAEITVSHLDNALLLAASLSCADLRLRLAATIYRLSGADALSEVSLELPVTREEIGEIAGLSRNTAGRLLADLARADLIETHYGRIVIKDPKGLEALLRS